MDATALLRAFDSLELPNATPRAFAAASAAFGATGNHRTLLFSKSGEQMQDAASELSSRGPSGPAVTC
jgi:hypothetical protein